MDQIVRFFQSILDLPFLGNTVLDYLRTLGLFFFYLLVIWVFQKIILGRLKKLAERTETTWDDFLVKQLQDRVVPVLYYGTLWLAIQGLALNASVSYAFNAAGILLLTYNILRFLSSTAKRFIQDKESKALGEGQRNSFRGLFPAVNTLIWAVGIVFLLDNFGFDISAIVAGLGIGGVAVALAAQAILGDLFSYFSIMLDKPFEIGDFVIIGDFMGAIEHVGLKTTRIRSLSGEQVIFSNTDLTSSRVRNYKRMTQRRVVFKLGLVHETPVEKLSQAVQIIRESVEHQNLVRFDRAHFFSFGSFSLDFEVVYYVLDGDYNVYMNIQQAINLEIMSRFQAKGLEFAYPTQVVHLPGMKA